MTLKKPTSQPTGYVFNDPQDGTIIIGKNPNSKGRTRQVELSSQSLGSIRLFEDGAFDIRSNSSATQKDNIISESKDGLAIYSSGKGMHIDAGNGELTISARSIVIQTTGSSSETGGITIRSNHNITLDSADHVKIEGSTVAIGSKFKMFIGSAGPVFIRGKGGVTISEPKNSLIPTNLNDVLEKIVELVFPEYI